MASQITGNQTVCSTSCTGLYTKAQHHWSFARVIPVNIAQYCGKSSHVRTSSWYPEIYCVALLTVPLIFLEVGRMVFPQYLQNAILISAICLDVAPIVLWSENLWHQGIIYIFAGTFPWEPESHVSINQRCEYTADLALASVITS